MIHHSNQDSAKHNQRRQAKQQAGGLSVAKDQPAKKDLTLAELKEKAAAGKGDAKKSVKELVKKEDTKDAYKILIRPIVTEKGTYLGAQNKYIFEVGNFTNKIEVKKAIHAVYGVTPIKINMVNVSGKNVRHGKTYGRTKDRKKAIITLNAGDKIEVYEGV